MNIDIQEEEFPTEDPQPYKQVKKNPNQQQQQEDEQEEEDEYDLPDNIEDIDQDELLQAIAEAEQNENLAFDQTTLEKLIKQFDHNIAKNSQLRSEFQNKPERFMESEIELDEKIKRFGNLTAYPELLPIFVNSNAIQNIILLLSHENSDIKSDIIQFLKDFVQIELDNNEEEKYSMFVDLALKQFIKYGIFKGLFVNLEKLNEEKKEDYQLLFKILEIIDGILVQEKDFIPNLLKETDFLNWLVKRLQLKLKTRLIDENKLYCAEILSLLLSNKEVQSIFVQKIQGIQIYIELLAQFKSQDPSTEEDREYILNLFLGLDIILIEKQCQDEFRKQSGIDLLIKMIKEKKYCAKPALKTLMYSLQNNSQSCQYFIEIQGLKYTAPIMVMKGLKSKKEEEQKSINEQVFTIYRHLIKETKSVGQERVVNKFRENDFEKIDRLFELHNFYFGYINEIDRQMSRPDYIKGMQAQGIDIEEIMDTIYMKKQDLGLSILESIDFLILFLLQWKDSDISEKIQKSFRMHNKSDEEAVKTITDLKKYFSVEESEKDFQLLEKLIQQAKNKQKL